MPPDPHPNPAEVCRQRGREEDDTIEKDKAAAFTITHIGKDYITGEWPGGVPDIFRNRHDISDWSKVPPPPRYTVKDATHVPHVREIRRDEKAIGYCSCCSKGDGDFDRFITSGLAALNAGPEPVKATEGPYKARRTDEDHKYEVVSRENIYGVELTSYIQTRDEFSEDVTDEILSRHAREIASEFNRLANAPGTVAGA